jgi:hypothetical protein
MGPTIGLTKGWIEGGTFGRRVWGLIAQLERTVNTAAASIACEQTSRADVFITLFSWKSNLGGVSDFWSIPSYMGHCKGQVQSLL